MKIFSNFDTELKKAEYSKAVQQYGQQNVLLVSRGKIFWLLFVCLPVLWWSTVFLSFAVLVALWAQSGVDSLTIGLSYGIIGVVFLACMIYPIKKYIDYTMDYAIVTPDEVSFHNQSGLFNSRNTILNAVVIKTIYVEKNGFIRSLFNYGTIVFLAE